MINILQINQFAFMVYFVLSYTNGSSLKLRKVSKFGLCSHITVLWPMEQSSILSAKIGFFSFSYSA